MKKIIIYYQHTRDYNFEERHSNTISFGKVIKKENELILIFEKHHNDCEMEKIYKNRIDTFYKYNNKNNCKQIYNYILKINIKPGKRNKNEP